MGAIGDVVVDQRTGMHFLPNRPEDLAAKVDWAWTHPRQMEEMGQAGRAEYLAKYTGERNLRMLTAIYERAIEIRKAGSTHRRES